MLTRQQLAELTRILRAKRDELQRRRVAAPDDRVLEVEADPMDEATDVTSEAEAAGVAVHDARILHEIEDAFARMGEGKFGLSEESGAPIAYERLRAVPWARRTASEEERDERGRGNRRGEF